MSDANVQVIERFHASLPDDIAQLTRSDEEWRAWVEEVAPFFHSDWETVRPSAPGSDDPHMGFDGFRVLWLG